MCYLSTVELSWPTGTLSATKSGEMAMFLEFEVHNELRVAILVPALF